MLLMPETAGRDEDEVVAWEEEVPRKMRMNRDQIGRQARGGFGISDGDEKVGRMSGMKV